MSATSFRCAIRCYEIEGFIPSSCVTVPFYKRCLALTDESWFTGKINFLLDVPPSLWSQTTPPIL